jgi:protein-L-isoaspartate(D-aspartate) O-methyltransferase
MELDEAHPIHTDPSSAETANSDRLQERRRTYAHRIVAVAGVASETALGGELAAAFESIPREKFVGPPPWNIVSPEGYAQGNSADPAVLYQDVLVPLRCGAGLNNGQPSLHALCLWALAPVKGESAIHVGAGSGYYTAVLARLVGAAGRVDAYEIMPELAQQAAENLADLPQVFVHGRSGAEGPLPECDVLYVSAAAAEPLSVWLDALRPGGRLLFPLEAKGDPGQMLLVSKKVDGSYPAQFLCGVQFVPCLGAQEPNSARALNAAFRSGHWSEVKQLYRNDCSDESAWCAGNGWWLSTR